ncbi:MAG: ankyrin repeat domain-containing protein [Planctomycetes bacterium]|nr:ankyrin repeat domain-containing protein [Planctomycetota bacterium]
MTHRDRELLKESRRGHVVRIERLVADGADVNCRGKYGYTPLMEAASSGQVEAVRALLARGADATLLAADNAPTPFYACVRGHGEIVELLLDAGASPNAHRDSGCSTREGDTPGVSMLHVGIRQRHVRIVEALLRAGAYTDFVVFGQDALAAAVETGDEAIIDLVRRRVRRR